MITMIAFLSMLDVLVVLDIVECIGTDSTRYDFPGVNFIIYRIDRLFTPILIRVVCKCEFGLTGAQNSHLVWKSADTIKNK